MLLPESPHQKPVSSRSSRLFIRMTSLGDVILATSALEVARNRQERVDWIVSKEYQVLLKGHPAVGSLWTFDRRTGLAGWLEMARSIASVNYDQVVDLHGSLRSKLLYLYLLVSSVFGKSRMPQWRSTSKQRARLYLFYFLKRYFPAVWWPTRVVEKAARAAGGTGHERPNLKHLLLGLDGNEADNPVLPLLPSGTSSRYFCVMPSSRWSAKNWPVERYADVIGQTDLFPVILGGPGESSCLRLVELLRERNIPLISGVGVWSLPEVARVLAGSQGYLGNDTGLAHLAEAVGVKATVIFGPTVPEMGFGPWRPESQSVGSSLGCRPCGKDGRYCFRVKNRYLCMTQLKSEQVRMAVEKHERT